MTSTMDEPSTASDRDRNQPRWLPLAGVASIGAGMVHAAAVGVHNEHRQAVLTFIVVAVFQVGWGVLALATRRPTGWRAVALVGALGNAGLVVGFIVAKTTGLGFIDGLESSEPVEFADGLAAALAAVVVILALVDLLRGNADRQAGRETDRDGCAATHHDHMGRRRPSAHLLRSPGRDLRNGVWALGIGAVAVSALTVPAMLAAANPAHHAATAAEGHGEEHAGRPAASTGESHAPAVARAYDPTQPVDLGGVEGVTSAQQAAAENVVSATLLLLPRWADPAVAEAGGFRSIGDGSTGYEHYINAANMADGRELDPSAPESLVYKTSGTGKELVAAMYIAEPGKTLETVPTFGGALTQWHVHEDLCFTTDARVAGLTLPDGTCRPPLVKTGAVPMIHVWITPNRCGPFASLEGIGAGQVKAGEMRACDAAHGGH